MQILITGGVKSGKSTRALFHANEHTSANNLNDQANSIAFIATATAFDDEMKERIANHKKERDKRFYTIEEPFLIDAALQRIKSKNNFCIIDCIPMWLNNMFFTDREAEIFPILEKFLLELPENCVIVTNEIGMGLIPIDPLSRRYGVSLGKINTMIAQKVNRVELMVAGLPVIVK